MSGATSEGFTLIELMISIVILAILATLAAPSFVEYVANQRLRNATYDLTAALQMARSESIKRNCSAQSTDCLAIDIVPTDGTDWSSGWKVQTKVVTVGDTPVVIRRQNSYKSVSISNNPTVTTISYTNEGRTTTATTKFTIQPAITISGVSPRCVMLSLSGVPTSRVGACS